MPIRRAQGDLMKTSIILCTFAFLASCSTMTKMDQASTDMSNGAYKIENAANSIDRAIATEKRIESKFETKK